MTKQVVEIKTKKRSGVSINELYDEKKAVYKILNKWRIHAFANKKQARFEECNRVIAFLDILCK